MRKLDWLKQRLVEPFGDECVEWPWSKDRGGYGFVCNPDKSSPSKMVRVHRLVCAEVHSGPSSRKGCVLHLCDNPACFNPKHLRWGSQLENIRDRNLKGRTAKKVEDSDLAEIFRLRQQGLTLEQIGTRFNIRAPQVSYILNGKSRSKKKETVT